MKSHTGPQGCLQTPSAADSSPACSGKMSTTSLPLSLSWTFSSSCSHVPHLPILGYSVVPAMLALSFSSPLQCISFHDKSCVLVTTKGLVVGPLRPTVAAGASVSASTNSDRAPYSVYRYGQRLSSPSLPVAKRLKQNQSTHLDPVTTPFRSQVNKEFLSHSLSVPHSLSSTCCYLIRQGRPDIRSSIFASDTPDRVPFLFSFTIPQGGTNLTPNRFRESIVRCALLHHPPQKKI